MSIMIKQEECSVPDDDSIDVVKEVDVKVERLEKSSELETSSDENHLLRVPSHQLPPTVIFHPGCKVVCMDYERGDPLVSFGTVLYVLVDLSSVQYTCKIQPIADGEPFLAKSASLQFGQGEPVWVKLSSGYMEGFVLSSAVRTNRELRYDITHSSAPWIHYGIPAGDVRCRPVGSARPILQDDGADQMPVGERDTSATESARSNCDDRESTRNVASFTADAPRAYQQVYRTDDNLTRSRETFDESRLQKRPRTETESSRSKRALKFPQCFNFRKLRDAVSINDVRRKARALHTRIFEDFHGSRRYPLILHLEGPTHLLDEVIQLIILQALECAMKGDRIWAMHEISIANGMATYDLAGVAVSLLKPPVFSKRAYVCVIERDRRGVSGKRESAVVALGDATQCAVEVVQRETRRPHVYVTGDSVEQVLQCHSLLKRN